MTQAVRQQATSSDVAPTPVEQIAKQLNQPIDLVQELYNRTMESIAKHAKISQFIGVIVTRQVLDALRRREANIVGK